jgi:hypothetical protein
MMSDTIGMLDKFKLELPALDADPGFQTLLP